MENKENVHEGGRLSPKKLKKPMNGWLVALCIICGCIVFASFWSHIFGSLISLGSTSSTQDYVPLGDTIDVIHVEGVIAEGEMSYNHKWTLEQIDSLITNDFNKAIMLYVNSPGGGIYESDELYLKLKEYKEITGRPVYAYMAQTAASGGLYVCMAADKIYANRMTLTGSIGVILSLTDTTGLEELIGIKEENIVSGNNKAMGNPLTDEQRNILQSIIDESYNIFVDVVAENRNLDKNTVKKIADGRVYSPLQAKELKIIDEIGSFETALNDLKTNYDLKDCEVYTPEEPVTFLEELLYSFSDVGNIDGKLDVNQAENYINKNSGIKLMYMLED